MRKNSMRISNRLLALTITLALPMLAQPPAGRGGPPPVAKAAAPIDITGYWVSIVNEDWRYRMVTPAPGDYQGVPMTPAAVTAANTWDPAKDEAAGDQCKSYGAPAMLRVPGHLHFTWQDDQTLKLDLDAGTQTRLFHFGNWKAPTGPATLQGDSQALWEIQRPSQNGSLKVNTTHLKAGYLRKNGVPYSDNATLAEYFDVVKEANGDQMLIVTIVTTDPMYLREPFIITSHFKKQASEAGWKPTACSSKW